MRRFCEGFALHLSNIMENTAASTAKKPKKRTSKPLPAFLLAVSDKERSKFGISLEVDKRTNKSTYGNEFQVVQTVMVKKNAEDEEEEEYDIDELNLDQIRELCKRMGVANCGSSSKFDCRKAIATSLLFKEKGEKHGLTARTSWGRITSSVCRAINVVFSAEFYWCGFDAQPRRRR